MESRLSILADQLLRWDIQLVVVLSFSFVLIGFIPRNQAALKHWVLLVLVAATLSMPAFSLLLPPLAVFRARPTEVDVKPLVGTETVDVPLDRSLGEGNEPLRLAAGASDPDVTEESFGLSSSPIGTIRGDKAESYEKNVASGSEERAVRSSQVAWTSWKVAFLFVWASGAFLLSLRVALAWAHLRRRWRDSLPATISAEKTLDEACQQLKVRRNVSLRLSDSCNSPMTWGSRRPKVILPATAENWSEDRLRTILLHEVAHVKRYDSACEYLLHVLCITHWFQPLTWVVAWQSRIQRERACDNAVLRQGVLASEYAECILAFAVGSRLPSGAIAMANVGGLHNRLKLILHNSSRPSLTFRKACFSGAIATGLCLFVASLQIYASADALPSTENESAAKTTPAAANIEQAPVQFGGRTLLVGGVLNANYSPDGTVFATISRRGNLNLWDTITGKHLAYVPANAKGLAFSPTGSCIATRGGVNSPIRIWDSTTGNQVSSIAVEAPTSAEMGNLETIDIKFVDDATLVTVHPQLVRRWNLLTGKEDLSQRRLLRLGQQNSIFGAVSPFLSDDGRLVVERNAERLYIDKLGAGSIAPAIDYASVASISARGEFCDSGGMIAFLSRALYPPESQNTQLAAFDILASKGVSIPATEGVTYSAMSRSVSS